MRRRRVGRPRKKVMRVRARPVRRFGDEPGPDDDDEIEAGIAAGGEEKGEGPAQ